VSSAEPWRSEQEGKGEEGGGDKKGKILAAEITKRNLTKDLQSVKNNE